MTGFYLLDWPIMAVSLFNTILLLWLGLTVLLNAEHRTWGVWLSGGGLLLGGAFFVSHSAILGYGLDTLGQGLNFWWRAGWLPVVISPLAWYVAMLWYAGFWDRRRGEAGQEAPLQHHRLWLTFVGVLALSLVGLLILANPLPSYIAITQLKLSATPEVGGLPVLMLVYPLYIVLCIVLSLIALRHPAPSGRVMGDLARRRAKPWLVAASLILLLVSLLVAWVIGWVVLYVHPHAARTGYTELGLIVAWFDLVIASLIAVAIILLGRAIVSYEVFTGKTLPRRGFFRHWRSAVILAAGYGLIVGWSLTIQLRPIYSLLLTTMLMVAFYALFSWRSFAERDHYIALLRPFAASQRLYEHLLMPLTSLPAPLEAKDPFQALCAEVLGTRVAYLVALGPLAPFVAPALTYPDGLPVPALVDLIPHFDAPQKMCIPLDPTTYGGALWAVSLWSERGLIGLLLLGDKRDGGLYTQEEIEIARASGERLIDTQATVEMARRLMALQRQQLAQSQVVDRRTRRLLHDDILPALHTAMLTLSSGSLSTNGSPANGPAAETVALLTAVHQQIADLLRDMPPAVAPEITRLGLVAALRRVVDSELATSFDRISWQIEPEADRRSQSLPALTAEVLFYAAREAMRNAARHGRAGLASPLHLNITLTWRDGLEIRIEDNGVGLAAAGLPNGGSGQGLALHSTMLAVIGGTLAMESVPGMYTRVSLALPSIDATW